MYNAKPLMTPAQFRALTAVDHRTGAVDVERFRDCSLSTIRAMGRSDTGHAPWVDVVWTKLTRNGRIVNTITHATITVDGIEALDIERARRAREAARLERAAGPCRPASITASVDPFALVRRSQPADDIDALMNF